MTLKSYGLDKIAHDLVFACQDNKDLFNQAFKMRTTAAYGLERFWGEKLRLSGEEAQYWDNVWVKLKEIMAEVQIEVPNHEDVNQQVTELWLDSDIARDERKMTLAVLTQLCDCMIWWTQRYKKA